MTNNTNPASPYAQLRSKVQSLGSVPLCRVTSLGQSYFAVTVCEVVEGPKGLTVQRVRKVAHGTPRRTRSAAEKDAKAMDRMGFTYVQVPLGRVSDGTAANILFLATQESPVNPGTVSGRFPSEV